MTDFQKLQTIKQWVEESISQGNAPILAYAIRDVINQKEDIQSPIKLSEKSMKILEEKRSKRK